MLRMYEGFVNFAAIKRRSHQKQNMLVLWDISTKISKDLENPFII